MAGLSAIASHPLRPMIDAALVAGESPATVAAQTGLPRSSVYRYARGRHSPLQPQWLTPDTTVPGAAADLSEVRIELLRRFRDAAERGADLTVTRLAREVANVSAVLKREYDVDADHDEVSADYTGQIVNLLSTLLYEVPGLYAAARATDPSAELLADLDALEQRMTEYRTDLQKEN